eukprot:GHVQ01022797.1.p1 GENE.GHVQ01022797.1~~GHVQ01022797.1.p1  ORF type:complete len:447 (-),score=41.00 GHVQ01022797.1:377-1717(-)
MGIDINWLRSDKGGNVEAVRESELKRGRNGAALDQVIEVDNEWRQAIYKMEQEKKDCNAVNKQIGLNKKKGLDCSELMEKSGQYKKSVPEFEKKAAAVAAKRDGLLGKIGNLIHSSVHVSSDEANNPVIRKWGVLPTWKPEEFPNGILHHHEILAKLNGYESKKAVEIAGHRAFFLRGPGVMLNMALIQYGLNFLVRKGYIPLQPPYFMRKEVMAETAELQDFEETLYRIPVDEGKDSRDDMFLIATSEQPIAALHRGEHLAEKDLPIRYAGTSTCFRKEAGSHGKDTWGLFRIHQFEKVEQFCITTPEKSWEVHEEMVSTSQEFYESLNLPYRVVSIVSGALNDAAAKKCDLEAWFPGYEGYRELVSCSNCTDYQARALEVRLGHKVQGETEKRFVNMLNGTLVATERCLCCILENYQTPDGVRVPRALVPYMGGTEFLKYQLQF